MVRKDATVRQAEILDAALQLFLSRGFDATTINDILDATGLSKGAFYHHFEAKDDVLAALVKRMSAAGLAAARAMLDAAGPDTASKLTAFFAGGSRYKLENVEALRGMLHSYWRDENLRLQVRMQAAMVDLIVPVLAETLAEGKRTGELSIGDPEETARVLLHIATLINDAFLAGMRLNDRTAATALCSARVTTTERAIERLLGLREGSFTIVPAELIDALFRVHEEERMP
jgi:AcrR family transcriptional regulator